MNKKLALALQVVAVSFLLYCYTASAAVTDTMLATKPQKQGLTANIVSITPLTPKSKVPVKAVKKPAVLTQKSKIPAAESKYRSYLVREARRQAGMEAPVAMWAAQIHAESAWRPNAKSAYASGLTQFTPDTEKWIIGLFPKLGNQGVQDPEWAMRAMITYDLYLKSKVKAKTECDDWAKTLSAYNGGLGWVYRDEKMSAARGKDPMLWWGNVEMYSPRAPQFTKENRDYPAKILLKYQPLYLSTGWYGSTTLCGEKL